MSSALIATQEEFEDLCQRIRSAGRVAFDTEFVSEDTYRPDLCLLQFAAADWSAAVDPKKVNLDSWWEIMTGTEVEVVVHGGREEVRFCIVQAGKRPGRLVDIQIAEGLRSPSFPLGYTALVGRVLGARIHGKETRTDWRRRPLSPAQIEYALEDVIHVIAIWDAQRADLEARGRLAWAAAEFTRMIDEIDAERTRENFRRLPGVQRLSRRELAVLRELYAWREQESIARDRPARRTLRDDLLIELARRQPKTVNDLTATRDMNRSDYRRAAPQIIESIVRGQEVSDKELPHLERADKTEEEQVLGQLLAIALANRCLEIDVAMSLVGTNTDLRQLVRWHVFRDKGTPRPRITQDWRADVCGDLLTDVLDGRITLRVADPRSTHPLIFERTAQPE